MEDYSINSINIDEYDFFDFGCSNGESIRYGVEKFDGKRGVGIDIDYEKVKMARHNIKTSTKISDEHTAVCEDITKLSDYKLEKKVRFTTAMHFLEHVDSLSTAEKIIESAINLSKEFIYIVQPFADKDSELFSKGLKTYYSDWTEHTNLMTSYDFYKICRNFLYKGLIKDFIIFATVPILDSESPYIHPINSPINQHEYDANIHPCKDSNIEFEGLYKDINVYIILNDEADFNYAIKKINKDYMIIYDSRENIQKNTEIKLDDCDFVDIGFGNGNSLKFGIEKFGGKTALGIEKNYLRISQVSKKLGDFSKGFTYHKLLNENILDINTLDEKYYKKFNFTTSINVIEELDSIEELEEYIRQTSNLAKDFSYITHLNNDDEKYLNSIGFQNSLHSSNINHLFMTSNDYIRLLNKLRREDVIQDFLIFKRQKILDTEHKNICSLGEDNDEVILLDDYYINLDVFLLYKQVDTDFLTSKLKGEKILIYSSLID